MRVSSNCHRQVAVLKSGYEVGVTKAPCAVEALSPWALDNKAAVSFRKTTRKDFKNVALTSAPPHYLVALE